MLKSSLLNKTVALVEIGNSHEECLLTQVLALKKAGANVIWVTKQESVDRNPFLVPYFDRIQVVSLGGKMFQQLKEMRQLNRFFLENQVKKVILNTAQGAHIRNLCLTAPQQIEFIGIIHTLRKFQGSFTQKIIHRKIKKYLVLSDDLLRKVNVPNKIRVSSFYPISYPHFEEVCKKSKDEIWISIVGGVENRRKDLEGFLEIIRTNTLSSIRFLFLGKCDSTQAEIKEFKQKIDHYGAQKNVVFFDDFISSEKLDSYLKQSDFLLPLIHPNTASSEQYIENQISGMFNLAYSYQIPLLIHEAYASNLDLQKAGFLYSLHEFSSQISTFIAARNEKIVAIQSEEKWTEEYQFLHYLRFIES
jgi:glycosyltransferase involved in cell wall biosynthesis